MTVKNARNQKINRVIFVTQLVLAFALIFFAWPIQAQNDTDTESDSVPGLDLFDEDVEITREGWPQFSISAGIMYLEADGIFAARLPNGHQVTIIDFDRAGLKHSDTSYWLSVNWRSANSRWGAWFASWRYDVVGSRTWQDSLELPGGNEIPAGASVTSDFNAQWYILEATFSFYRSEAVDAGMGIGVHAVDLDTTISTDIQLGDHETKAISENLDVLAPLPNVLAYVSWKMAPKWVLVARMGYFTMDYDQYSGDMINAHFMVNYSVSPRWVLGAGYQFVDLNLEVEKTDFNQIYDIDFAGPMVYAKFRF
jgi:hypothetical protein